MKPEQERALIDAVLGDEAWHSSLKAETLRAFHARQRARQWTWLASNALLGLLTVTGVLWWMNASAPSEQALITPVVAPMDQIVLADDTQLLALFPPGTCFLAEIDGQKQLVFYQAEDEHTFMARIIVR